MPKMFITHNVADVDTWLSFKEERAGAVAAMGGRDAADFVAHDGSNAVAVCAEVDDPDAMMAALASPPAEAAEAMQRHGVQPPMIAYVAR